MDRLYSPISNSRSDINHHPQVEKFIESIFPSQHPKAIVAGQAGSGKSPEQIEKDKADWQEAKWDVIYMALAVFATLAFISALMVCKRPQFSSFIMTDSLTQ